MKKMVYYKNIDAKKIIKVYLKDKLLLKINF